MVTKNLNVGNTILEKGATYLVTFPAQGHWPEFRTVLRFVDQYFGGYSFIILDPAHLKQYYEGHGVEHDDITYSRQDLLTAKIVRSKAVEVLYGNNHWSNY